MATSQNNKKIAVIGGGYTGLVAAYKLAKEGHKVTIFEQNPIVGGLASGFKIEGANLERAYHHLFKTDTSILEFTEELGIGDKLTWHESSQSIYYKGRLYPFKGALDLIRFSPLSFPNRIRAGLVVLYLQLEKNWKKLEKYTAYEWMLKYSGKQVTEVIWEPLLRGKFDKYFNKVSMAWLWARIHIRAQSRDTGGEKLGYFDGGFQVFTDALTQKLDELGVTITTGVSTEAITSEEDGVSIKINGKLQSFDSCLVTTPSSVFAKLIETSNDVNGSYLDQLRSVNYLGARLIIFSSTQDLSPYYWHNINDIDLPFLVFIHHTRLIDRQFYNGKYIYYIAAYLPHDHELFNCDDGDIEKLWFKGIKTIFPQFDSKKIREKHFFRFANAQHIVEGDYAQHIPDHKTPLKNVYLANFSQIYPEDRGTNFAVRDGSHVADLISKN